MGDFLIKSKESSDLDENLLSNLWGSTEITLKETSQFSCYLSISKSLDKINYYEESQSWIYATGSFFYKDYSFNESLKKFLQDFLNNNYLEENMRGHYILVICQENKLHLLNDKLGVYRVFTNTSNTLFSSSFLKLWFSSAVPLILNKVAFYERAFTGYITAPDTLIESIKDITYQTVQVLGLTKRHNKIDKVEPGKKEMDFQIKALQDYFSSIYNLAEGKRISLGLSGGFDSRLIFSLLKPYSEKYFFTHQTGSVHNEEIKVVKELEKLGKFNLHIKRTKNTKDLDLKESELLLRKIVYFYDGRSANDSGAFSETATYDYNYHHQAGNFIGLNGKGGEIYRNIYSLSNKKYAFKDWYKNLICYPSLELSLPKNLSEELLNRIQTKIEERLEIYKKWDKWFIHRYYSEIRQADCEGNIVYAQNKVIPYIAPFLDFTVIKAAYQSFYIQGVNSDFQMKLIKEIWPEAAAIKSRYGYSFDKGTPLKSRLKSFFLRSAPFEVQLYRKRAITTTKSKSPKTTPLITSTIEFLNKHFPELNTTYCFAHYAQPNVLINLVFLLKEAQKIGKITL